MSLPSLSVVLGEVTIPSFDGYNERKFRVDVARMVSRIRLSGTSPSDEALVEFIIENCFLGSDHVKSLIKDWCTSLEALKTPITLAGLLSFIKDTYHENNPTVTTESLLELARSYVDLPVTDASWEGIVSAFTTLREKMILRPLDSELVKWVFSPMTETMRTGVIDWIQRTRIEDAQTKEMARLWKYTEEGLESIRLAGPSGLSGVSLPTQGTAVPTDTGPISLSELEVAIRKHVRTTGPLHRFSEGISSTPAPALNGFDQNAIDSLVRGHKVAPAGTAPRGSVPFSFDTSAASSGGGVPIITNRFKDAAVDELSQMMEGLKLFRQTVAENTKVIKEESASRVSSKQLKTSFAKPRQPPSSGDSSGVVSANFEVSSLVGSSQIPNVRCFYCGLSGHYKDHCEIVEQDILDGAKVMIGRDRKLRWVVEDKKTGSRVLGEEVKGHRDGARRNVVEVELGLQGPPLPVMVMVLCY
ncbi:hypothetical protein HDU67_005259 [Dinochytrium kinnereticum]|nr:hypothetical protein HDU67_005259 [Dinochytrium kinnereticum]